MVKRKRVKKKQENLFHKKLQRLYYDPPHYSAYAGIEKLAIASREPRSRVLEWLEGEDAYNMHRQVRKRFPRRCYDVKNVDDLWEIDVMDLKSIQTYNDGYKYLLGVIDVLSKFAWVEVLRDKSAKSLAKAFETVLERASGRVPIWVQSDKGGEFTGNFFQKMLKDRGISYRETRNPQTKAAVIERFIRTFKERLFRYFTHRHTWRYVEVLQSLVDSYNYSKHSATKMVPATVTISNAAVARENLKHRYAFRKEPRQPKYRVGNLVRISRERNVFAKGYESGWTTELFKISRISTSRQPHVYYLEDLSGDEIVGIFYEEELSRVRKDLNEHYFEIDEIIKESGKGRLKKYFVSFKGYPKSFNSWVRSCDLKNI